MILLLFKYNPYHKFVVFIISVIAFGFVAVEPVFSKDINVGVYSNKPLVFQNEAGQYQGFTIDILHYIAEQEDWTLQFVSGSWTECLKRLENEEIDLQVAIAFSMKRSKRYDYSDTTLITNWGRLYRNPETVAESLLDIDGKKIALLKNDIHAKVFADLMEKFSKKFIPVYLHNYDEILKQTESGSVDLGVVNRMYAMQNAMHYKVDATPMIFNPIQVRYAAPKGSDPAILQAIDRHLQALRADKDSIYYQSLEKWFSQDHAVQIPRWVISTLVSAFILILIIISISLLLKKQVASKTKDLLTVFNSSPAAIFIHEMDGTILDLNQTMLDMYGVNKAEGLKLSIAEDYSDHTNPLNILYEYWKKVSEGHKQKFEWLACRPGDGSTFPVLVDLERIIYGNRQVIYALINDISAIKEVEQTLASEREQLAVTLRSIGDGVITTDKKGRILLMNKVAEELCGWRTKDAIGEPSSKIFNIINEKTGEKCASPVQRVLELGRIIGLANHTALIAKDGSRHAIADSGAPIRDKESNIIGVVLVFRDVTHERRIEEDLLRTRKLESVGVLAGGIAHDFNNILAAIMGNIELAGYRVSQEDSKTITLLANAKEATKRATKLTQQLLTFSKGGEPVRAIVALPEIIKESADFVLHGSQVVSHYNIPQDLWQADVDSGQIGQVIQNIVLNAKNAMPEGGVITIQCTNILDAAAEMLLSVDDGNYIRIDIHDTGVGVPKHIIDKIFDPYFTTKQEGSGLGLAICHSIINKHDGHFTVKSKEGQGSTFTLYLPAQLSSSVSVNPLTSSFQKINKAVKAALIMVMDDEKMLRDVAASQLSTLGHEALLVENGKLALNRYQELQDSTTPVDVVIMDLTIPGGMGGQETAEKLLKIDPDAKIIVASGYSNDPAMANYQKYGFCAAIAKPFDLSQLRHAIEVALR